MSGQIVIAALFVLRRLRFCNRREHTSESVKGVTKLDDLVVDPEPVVGVVDATPKLSYIRPTPGSHLAARSRHPATRVDSGPVSPAFPELSLDSLPVVRKANLPSHPGSVEAVTEVVGQVRGALASHSAPSTVSLEETLLPTRSRVASHTSLEAPSDLEGRLGAVHPRDRGRKPSSGSERIDVQGPNQEFHFDGRPGCYDPQGPCASSVETCDWPLPCRPQVAS